MRPGPHRTDEKDMEMPRISFKPVQGATRNSCNIGPDMGKHFPVALGPDMGGKFPVALGPDMGGRFPVALGPDQGRNFPLA